MPAHAITVGKYEKTQSVPPCLPVNRLVRLAKATELCYTDENGVKCPPPGYWMELWTIIVQARGRFVELSELTAYAGEQFHIYEQHKWAAFPGFSVLADPNTGKWVALLMRQWDAQTGTQIERCDIKCGRLCPDELTLPFLSPPFRMKGRDWVGVSFGSATDPAVVYGLLDRAVRSGTRRGFTIVLDAEVPAGGVVFRASALLTRDGARKAPPDDKAPDKLREMLGLYEYGHDSFQSKCRNFYRQGMCMADYEDDAPWNGEWKHYFPTYHDMNLRQLRGYFTWRARLRRGDYQPTASSFAYVYLYELLNGIGVDSPEDTLRKMRDFEVGYLDAGIGDPGMRKYLHRWMLEFAVLHALAVEDALRCADPSMLEKDHALSVLKSPAAQTDEAVFSALCLFSDQKIASSPVVTNDKPRGEHLFAEVWRRAAGAAEDGALFQSIFGERKLFSWYPLSNAVYWERERSPDTDYILTECRSYRCRNNIWQESRYDGLSFDRDRLCALLHESDRQLRKYLKTGHYLRERPEERWAAPYAQAAINADRQAALEAARPKITIDLSGLDQIRRDALTTRDSLLTEEERQELSESERAESAAPAEHGPADSSAEPALDELQTKILTALLRGEPVKECITAQHLMPSLVADAINEALFDEIGDTVLDCDGDTLAIVEDYREDLERMLGGDNR